MMQTETLAAVRGTAKWELIAAVVTEVLNCRQNGRRSSSLKLLYSKQFQYRLTLMSFQHVIIFWGFICLNYFCMFALFGRYLCGHTEARSILFSYWLESCFVGIFWNRGTVMVLLEALMNTLCVFVGTGFSHFSVCLLGAQNCCYLSQTCQIHNILL